MSDRFTLIIPPGSHRALMLTGPEFARLFDNRDPRGWSKPVTLFTSDQPEPLSPEVLAMLGHPDRTCPAQPAD
ncbi:hypothetical protein [Paracoccus aminophilus]|uniref:hypothetical protein n=1 Tax=Paracoccus aminophilus TaxID=34003 RepID=UPI0004210E8C|nr:hypothetical protein [Paracoccus aminophilus]